MTRFSTQVLSTLSIIHIYLSLLHDFVLPSLRTSLSYILRFQGYICQREKIA